MKIERLQVHAFGGLRDFETGTTPLSDFVVVQGANEAGKSSLTEILRCTLHGIYPASREGNPWTPWEGRELSFEAWVQDRQGQRVHIERKLQAQPRGTLTELSSDGSERSEELRNRSLPWADHVVRDVYAQVHRITLSELMALQEGNAWTGIRDRILAGTGTRDLASPRVVAEALDGEALRRWRPDRRGRSEAAEVDRRFKACSDAHRAAVDRENAAQGARRELEEGERRLETLRRTRAEWRERLRRGTAVLAAENRIMVLENHLAHAGELAEHHMRFPQDLREVWRRLQGAVDSEALRVREVQEELAALDAADEAPSPWDTVAATRAHELAPWLALAPEIQATRERIRGLQIQIDDEKQQASTRARESLTEGESVPDLPALSSVPLREVAHRLAARSEAEVALVGLRAALTPSAPLPSPAVPSPRAPSTFWVLLGTGLMLILASLLFWSRGGTPDFTGAGDASGPPGSAVYWITLAAGLVVMGVALALRVVDQRAAERGRSQGDAQASARTLLEAQVRAQEQLRDTALSGALDLLGPLLVRQDRLLGSGESLVADLAALRDTVERVSRLEAQREADEARIQAWGAEGRALLEPFGLATAPLDPSRIQGELNEAILRARRRDERTGLRAKLTSRLHLLTPELDLARAEHRDFQLQVLGGTPLDPGTFEAELDALSLRLESAREAARLRAELEREFGDLTALRAEIMNLSLDPELQAMGGIEGAADWMLELDGRIEAQVRQNEALSADIQRALTGESLDVLEGELMELRLQRTRLRRERDRNWLLARIIRVAEREFRDRNQPRLIQEAESRLRLLTGGRYDRIRLGEDGDPDALRVAGPAVPESMRVDTPLSTGTREQIWFSLRLAVVSLAEAGGTPLPLLLDEVFVNWDPERRRAGFDTLRDLSKERQVFFLTCHPEMAQEAVAAGAQRLVLPPPR